MSGVSPGFKAFYLSEICVKANTIHLHDQEIPKAHFNPKFKNNDAENTLQRNADLVSALNVVPMLILLTKVKLKLSLYFEEVSTWVYFACHFSKRKL